MTIKLKVPDMACDVCAQTITQAIQNLDNRASVTADSQTKQITIETQASESSIREAITSAGFNPA